MKSPLQAVLEVSLLFAQQRNTDRLLQLVVEKAVEIADAERGCIALHRGDLLVPQASVGIRPKEGKRISNTLAREVLESGTAKMWEDIREDRAVSGAQSILKQHLRSAMAAPLLVGGKTLGILYVDATTRGNYLSADLAVFQALANQAAIAIQNAQLFQEVITDPLTGLYSAGIFYRRLGEEIERYHRYDRPASLLLADLNGIKAINERHGHTAGDRALLSLAGIIRGNIRRGDLPFRYGGDEFAVIMPEAGREAVESLRERLEDACQAITDKELSGWRGASFGSATCPDDGTSPAELISAADTRLLEEKRQQQTRWPR